MDCLRLKAGSTLATCAARAGSLPSRCAGRKRTSGKLVLQSGSSWNLPSLGAEATKLGNENPLIMDILMLGVAGPKKYL